uniref:Chemokine interleukin-8-like domain-containing protein n=1 Tax=Sinocyclocheilus grahami TaxID=75366 RepID=A0A672MG21_SINGR
STFFCLTVAAGREVMYSCCNKVSTAKVTDPIIDIRLQHESLPCVKAEKVKQFFADLLGFSFLHISFN